MVWFIIIINNNNHFFNSKEITQWFGWLTHYKMFSCLRGSIILTTTIKSTKRSNKDVSKRIFHYTTYMYTCKVHWKHDGGGEQAMLERWGKHTVKIELIVSNEHHHYHANYKLLFTFLLCSNNQ